jgi:hypothetical protein
MGIPHMGVPEICTTMIRLLRHATKTLDVTHVAIGEDNASVLSGIAVKEWLEENYIAAQRGVYVRRVFIIDRDTDQSIFELMRLMSSKSINIYYCYREALDDSIIRDFSIYDKKSMVYIEPNVSGWKNIESVIRESVDKNIINEFEERFHILLGRSEKFNDQEKRITAVQGV